MKISLQKKIKIILELSKEEAVLLKDLCNRPVYFPEFDEDKILRQKMFTDLLNQLKELE